MVLRRARPRLASSPSHHLATLLAPPPLYSSPIRAAQMPSSDIPYANPKLVVRCDECLKSRWCQRCHKWWCETCFQPGAATSTEQALELINEIVDAGPVGEFDAGLVVKPPAGTDRLRRAQLRYIWVFVLNPAS